MVSKNINIYIKINMKLLVVKLSHLNMRLDTFHLFISVIIL